MKIVHLEVVGSWGARTYRMCGFPFEQAASSPDIRVRWPDGYVETYPIRWRRQHVTVSDRGIDSIVTNMIPYIWERVHGLRVRVDLEGLDLVVSD